jgi:hypothetical protein
MLREMQWQQRNLPNQGEILLVSLLVCAALNFAKAVAVPG